MKKEKSCGAIVINDDKVLLVKQNLGHYGFPKGHMEENETEEETAIREVKEETNIDIIVDTNKKITTSYMMSNGVFKEVVLFMATNENDDLKSQDNEIEGCFWIDIKEARNLLKYDNLKKVLDEVEELIK